MRMKFVAFLIVSLSIESVRAAEVRVVRFDVLPNSNPPPCVSFTGWLSETFFHNSTDVVQNVQFLGVSNGSARPNPTPLSVPPHQTVKINGSFDPFLNWDPMPGTIVWVNRLDVPPGVIVANRVASSVYDVGPDTTRIPCTSHLTNYAGLPLPVFSTLVPAGTTQYFLGTDIGSDPFTAQLDGRLNIGVYNGGTAAATATVRVYCGHQGSRTATPNSLVLNDQSPVPGNTVIQKTVVPSTLVAGCPVGGNEYFWYAAVIIDQPSFAYAIGLANGALPTFPGTVALTYTGN